MYYKQDFGKSGEDTAVKYLESCGYEIIERNFSCKIGEIDIIAKEGDYLVFVEVKSRKNFDYGFPIEAITKGKIRNIKKAAEFYLMVKGKRDIDIRFDVVEVIVGEQKEVRLTRNVF
jgi:putative endonuclease